MAWVRMVPEEAADGTLAAIYEASRQRAGRVFNIVKVQSLSPHSLRAGLGLYRDVVLSARSTLSRANREMIGVVVSQTNACRY